MTIKRFFFLLECLLQAYLLLVFAFMSYMKLSSSPEAVFVFANLGMESTGRFAIGILELGIVFLLLTKKGSPYGLVLAFGVLCGAFIAHATVLGWKSSLGYPILLFLLSFLVTLVMMFFKRKRLPLIGKSLIS